MKRLFSILSLILLSTKNSFAGVLCNPLKDTDCKPVIEHIPIKQGESKETALPVVIAYIHDLAKKIYVKPQYGTLIDLENDLDTQVINVFADVTKDNEYLKMLRDTGEVFNEIEIVESVDIHSRNPKDPKKAVYVYKGIILPSGSLIVLRRVIYGDYSYPTITSSEIRDKQIDLKLKSDTSPVITRTGVDFWKDYFAYYKSARSRGIAPKSPLRYFREDWKKLPRKVRNVELPPIFIIKNGKLLALRGKTVYGSGEVSPFYLSRVKTTEEWKWTLKDGSGKVIDSVDYPEGTDLLTIYKDLVAELADKGKYTKKALFLSKAIAKTILQTDKRAFRFFNFDAGYAYSIDRDGFHTYRIVYAGTPKVLQYKAENDVHYTQYGMDDPTKIYWNEPFRNAVVVPERIACLYYAKENCKRFTVYKPATEHEATNETLRYYYYDWKKQVGKNKVIPDGERKKIISVIQKAMWSETIDNTLLSGVDEKYVESLKKVVKKPLVLTSRTAAEENYVLTCNVETKRPEALFVIPKSYQREAEKVGQILKQSSNGLIGVYYDDSTRLPIPSTCESVQKVAKEQKLPSYQLQAPPPPLKVVEESQSYKEDLKQALQEMFEPLQPREPITEPPSHSSSSGYSSSASSGSSSVWSPATGGVSVPSTGGI